MWSRILFWLLFGLLLVSIANIAHATNLTNETNQTNMTLDISDLEENYLIIRIKAYVTNVSYWCKGEGVTTYELFGGLAECQHIEQKKECRCTVSLPDDVMPEYFLAYEQIEQRYDDAVDVKQATIDGLWFWIYTAVALAMLSIVGTIFYMKFWTRWRWRLSLD